LAKPEEEEEELERSSEEVWEEGEPKRESGVAEEGG